MPTCPLCFRYLGSNKGLVAHTEAKHGKANVHKLTEAWENSRGQRNIVTTGNGIQDGRIYVDEDECYDHNSDTYECPLCCRVFNTLRALEQHVNSGVHSAKSYRCDDCHRQFTSLTALVSHCENTSCIYANNVTQTLVNDYKRGPQLMLTNGSSYTEATLKFDGSAKPNPGYGGAGYILYSGYGSILESKSIEIMDHPITSNQAEYAAMQWGMKCAHKFNVCTLLVMGDSELIIKQMNGIYRVTDRKLKPLYNEAKKREDKFNRVLYEHIRRKDNEAANRLANEGADCEGDEQRYLY